MKTTIDISDKLIQKGAAAEIESLRKQVKSLQTKLALAQYKVANTKETYKQLIKNIELLRDLQSHIVEVLDDEGLVDLYGKFQTFGY